MRQCEINALNVGQIISVHTNVGVVCEVEASGNIVTMDVNRQTMSFTPGYLFDHGKLLYTPNKTQHVSRTRGGDGFKRWIGDEKTATMYLRSWREGTVYIHGINEDGIGQKINGDDELMELLTLLAEEAEDRGLI